jgi:hypothetical protein
MNFQKLDEHRVGTTLTLRALLLPIAVPRRPKTSAQGLSWLLLPKQ